MKTCTRCGVEKEANLTYFATDARASDRFQSSCRECCNKESSARYSEWLMESEKANLCIMKCGRERMSTIIYCQECRDQNNDKQRPRATKRRSQAKAENKCVMSGCENQANGETGCCASCRLLKNSESRERVAVLKEREICIRCGRQPIAGGHVQCLKCSEISRVKSLKARRQNPIRTMLQDAKTRAKRRGLEFSLTALDIVIPEFCPVLGIPLIWGIGKPHAGSPSLDRIDNSKGYTKENSIVVSRRANTLKNDATLEELRTIADFYEKLQKG